MANDRAAAYINRGNEYYKKGAYDQAIADYSQAIKLDPNIAEAYYNRGNAFANKGDSGRAIADWEAALRLNPSNDNARANIQQARRKMTSYKQEAFFMPDEKQHSGQTQGAFSRFDESWFTSFAKPYLDFIGKGKLFVIIYTVMAIINLLLPFVVFYKAIDMGLFKIGEAKLVFAFIFSWIVVVFACWIGFQLWWDRKRKIKSFEDSEFVVTPMFSDIFQTFGEWLGTLLGIIGAGVGLIATLMLGEYADLFNMIGIDFLPSGIITVVAGPLAGFFIIILFRFIAEQMRLLVALVINTKSIATNIKEGKRNA